MANIERTGWRDESLSRRHRRWGGLCTATDIDALFYEYNTRRDGTVEPACLVEYKNEHAAPQYANDLQYRALVALGERANLPVLACRYSDDFSTWKVTPLNAAARQHVPERVTLDEAGWVRLLYKIRGYDVPQDVINGINIEL